MTHQHETQSQKVIDHFTNMLGDDMSVSEEHLAELKLMIESAIAAAVFEESAKIANMLNETMNKIRNKAERYEN